MVTITPAHKQIELAPYPNNTCKHYPKSSWSRPRALHRTSWSSPYYSQALVSTAHNPRIYRRSPNSHYSCLSHRSLEPVSTPVNRQRINQARELPTSVYLSASCRSRCFRLIWFIILFIFVAVYPQSWQTWRLCRLFSWRSRSFRDLNGLLSQPAWEQWCFLLWIRIWPFKSQGRLHFVVHPSYGQEILRSAVGFRFLGGAWFLAIRVGFQWDLSPG